MMWNWQIAISRPVRDNAPSELIGGNDFLKMFFEHQQFHGNDDEPSFGGGISVADEIGKPASNNRSYNARSLDYKARRNGNGNENGNEHKDDKQQQQEQQQVVKLVTSGSKIVFLEEYDDDDAVVDAVAREIDLQREQKLVKHNNHNNNRPTITTTTTTARNKHQQQRSNTGEQYQVVAVSVSSSSKRGSEKQQQQHQHHQRQHYKQQSTTTRAPKIKKTTQKSTTLTTTPKSTTTTSATTTTTTTTTTTSPKRRPIAALPYDNAHFINLSHKSELSIEETEPLTMTPRKQQQHGQQHAQHLASLDTLSDSENSASTNVQNVLAAPLSHQNNKTSTASASKASKVNTDDNDNDGMEDKLLPFQTVIYHDTRSGEGHGPQSRSISYSSLSQNVEDIHSWQRSTGILAEAQRNVNESLKPTLNTKSNSKSESEPARYYSVPAKMYGEPSKFYSEPAKVYSEPAKIYGEPEKIYSEPAKVYGEPSKFYSEPAKVYSQPAKVYGEPAKTYWPQTVTESTSTSTTTVKPAYMPHSRRPAIVSRIAFGEAQFSSTTTTSTTTVRPPIVYRNHHSHYTQTRLHNQQQKQQQHGHVNTQPQRRVLFNLDRLPYDLLNAPEPTASKQQQQQHPAEPTNLADLAHGPISCFESELPLTASVSTSSASSATAIAQTAVSSLTVTHQPQQQQLLLIQQQHSSLSDQHSNQNAKRLPNRDLVKCVAKYIHPNGVGLPDVPVSAPAASHQTTERSHSEDIYSPTPEQNYEIEESVSVMTDGRAHGVVGGGMAGQIAATSTARPAHQRGAIRGNTSSLTSSLYHQQHGANANANKHHNHNNDDEGNYNYDGDDDDDEVEDDGNTDEKAGDDDDDSKVAYVVEGQNYRKYRVEEKTDDGFIVGEYGVVDHNDGNLRGVRYTADSTINPSLIQKALLTFLKLK